MSSTTSQTSTTISAHIDFGVRNAGLGTPETATHNPAATPPSAEPVGTFKATEFRLRNHEGDEKASTRLASFWDVPRSYKDDDEPDIMCRKRDLHSS